MINFLLVIALFVFTYFAPTIFWGTTYAELFELLNNEKGQKFSELLKTLGLTEQTVSQYVYTKIAICAAILIGGIILLIIINSLIKKKK